MGIGVSEINLAAPRDLRRANRDLPAVQSRAIDRYREEDVGVADGVVIEIIPGTLMIVVDVERPAAQREW